MSRSLRLLPAVLALLVVGLLVWRLAVPGEDTVPSRLVGRAVPPFALPAALPDKPGLASADIATGRPLLINIFASWCVPCVAEARVLGELARRGVPMAGIAVRDRPQDVAAFLAEHGDPFTRIGSDTTSQVQLALGSSGVPESFIVDGRGIIRFQHIGPLEPRHVPMILAQMEQAR